MRKKILAANWKMNLSKSESEDLLKNLSQIEEKENREMIICLPNIYLYQAEEYLKGKSYGIQNFYYESSGAFTGEISLEQAKDFGIKYAIVGHSERRTVFNESNELLNKKVKAALKNGITPIFCIGEPISERENSTYEAYLYKELKEGLDGVDIEDARKIIYAYEPIWAIGTGKTAHTSDIKSALEYIRNTLDYMYKGIKDDVHLLYGGSVKDSNIDEIMATEHVDGVLVGGASLKFDSWKRIVEFKE